MSRIEDAKNDISKLVKQYNQVLTEFRECQKYHYVMVPPLQSTHDEPRVGMDYRHFFHTPVEHARENAKIKDLKSQLQTLDSDLTKLEEFLAYLLKKEGKDTLQKLKLQRATISAQLKAFMQGSAVSEAMAQHNSKGKPLLFQHLCLKAKYELMTRSIQECTDALNNALQEIQQATASRKDDLKEIDSYQEMDHSDGESVKKPLTYAKNSFHLNGQGDGLALLPPITELHDKKKLFFQILK